MVSLVISTMTALRWLVFVADDKIFSMPTRQTATVFAVVIFLEIVGWYLLYL